MLLDILNSPYDVFQTSDLFIVAVKHYLMVSLTRNSLSTVMPVVELSLEILIRVIRLFRQNLKVITYDYRGHDRKSILFRFCVYILLISMSWKSTLRRFFSEFWN